MRKPAKVIDLHDWKIRSALRELEEARATAEAAQAVLDQAGAEVWQPTKATREYLDLRARGVLDGGKSWPILVIGPDGRIYLFDSGVGCAAMCGETDPCVTCGPALREARRECMRRVRKAVQSKKKRASSGRPDAPEEKQNAD